MLCALGPGPFLFKVSIETPPVAESRQGVGRRDGLQCTFRRIAALELTRQERDQCHVRNAQGQQQKTDAKRLPAPFRIDLRSREPRAEKQRIVANATVDVET